MGGAYCANCGEVRTQFRFEGLKGRDYSEDLRLMGA